MWRGCSREPSVARVSRCEHRQLYIDLRFGWLCVRNMFLAYPVEAWPVPAHSARRPVLSSASVCLPWCRESYPRLRVFLAIHLPLFRCVAENKAPSGHGVGNSRGEEILFAFWNGLLDAMFPSGLPLQDTQARHTDVSTGLYIAPLWRLVHSLHLAAFQTRVATGYV